MFGYVRIDKNELKIREYECYRSVYCGLCRSMGKCTGCSSRLTLSYDFTFLLMIRAVLTRTAVRFGRYHCPVHPLKKRAMMEQNEAGDYVACAAGILLYYKCKDDLSDESGKRKAAVRAIFPTVKRFRKRALKRVPALLELDRFVQERMEQIAEAERTRIPSIDYHAALSGELLGEVFSFGLEGAAARIAAAVGTHVGKWIYLVDAFDDLLEDCERGRFNAFLISAGDAPPKAGESCLAFKDQFRENLRVALLNELSEVEAAVDLMDFDGYCDFYGAVRNILYLGMPNVADTILRGEKLGAVTPDEHQKGNG